MPDRSLDLDARELAQIAIACAFYGAVAAAVESSRGDPAALGRFVLGCLAPPRASPGELLAMRELVAKIADAMGLPIVGVDIVPPPPPASSEPFG